MIRVLSISAFCGAGVWAAAPLSPPVTQDMVILGQGPSNSWNTRAVTLGEGYVYCSGEPGLQTVRVSDPFDLQFISDDPDMSAQVNGSAVKGAHLYVANWSPNNGFVVFSLADPAQPVRVRTIVTPRHTWGVSIYDNLLYLTVGDETDAGFQTYDISSPADPAVLNTCWVGDRLANDIAHFGSYLYQTHKGELRVYDGTNPAAPVLVNTVGPFSSVLGEVQVQGSHLFMLGRAVLSGEVGGLWVFSLANPHMPVNVKGGANLSWVQNEPRDIYFASGYCIVPCSGSGIYTLDVRNPAAVTQVSHWYLPHLPAGTVDPITVTGKGRFAFIGTTSLRGDPGCEDFTCSDYGARLYSVQILSIPPVIAEVSPDPDMAGVGHEYKRRLLLQEDSSPTTWSLVAGPTGARVDGSGQVTGWTPQMADLGTTVAFEVRASNSDGADRELWNVHVQLLADVDFDNDQDVDQEDFGHFQACLTDDGQPQLDPPCLDCRLDEDDQDVDAQDLAIFLACYGASGPGVAAPAGCR